MATAVMESGSQQSERKITIDFTDTRRRSFLPDNFAEAFGKPEISLKAVKVLECHEDDDLFMYVGGDETSNEERPLKKFCTGSKYLGEWNRLGISGKGVYKYPHGVIYDGYFNKNGEFHGTGVLVYPCGQRIEGIWKNGRLGPDTNFVTKAGVVMTKNYCMMPDRRFQIEFEKDLNPPGQEYATDEYPPPRTIPDGCYDVVEGFYDPRVKTVYAYPTGSDKSRHSIRRSTSRLLGRKSSTKYLYELEEQRLSAISKVSEVTESEMDLSGLMMRSLCEERKIVSWIPTPAQEEWIMKNCRKAWDKGSGYRPDLYEEWTKGGSGTSYKVENENDSEFTSHLETLKLTSKKAKDVQKLKTFVKNRQEVQESVTTHKLAKIFLAKTTMTEIKMKGNGSIFSYEYDVPGEKR